MTGADPRDHKVNNTIRAIMRLLPQCVCAHGRTRQRTSTVDFSPATAQLIREWSIIGSLYAL
jgi:hypothetical protein